MFLEHIVSKLEWFLKDYTEDQSYGINDILKYIKIEKIHLKF